MANQKRKKLPAAEFQISEKVRVRHGVKDGDYPDMPLGGWAGTIAEFSDNGIYTVRWSEETLASIHPVFEKRCEKDGLEFDQYWLGADDLELDHRWSTRHRAANEDHDQATFTKRPR